MPNILPAGSLAITRQGPGGKMLMVEGVGWQTPVWPGGIGGILGIVLKLLLQQTNSLQFPVCHLIVWELVNEQCLRSAVEISGKPIENHPYRINNEPAEIL